MWSPRPGVCVFILFRQLFSSRCDAPRRSTMAAMESNSAEATQVVLWPVGSRVGGATKDVNRGSTD